MTGRNPRRPTVKIGMSVKEYAKKYYKWYDGLSANDKYMEMKRKGKEMIKRMDKYATQKEKTKT